MLPNSGDVEESYQAWFTLGGINSFRVFYTSELIVYKSICWLGISASSKYGKLSLWIDEFLFILCMTVRHCALHCWLLSIRDGLWAGIWFRFQRKGEISVMIFPAWLEWNRRRFVIGCELIQWLMRLGAEIILQSLSAFRMWRSAIER